jgi:hypothetical protein
MMIGYLANLALPRIGEVTRCVVLGKKEKIAVDKLVGTVIIERTIDFLSVLIFLILIVISSEAIIKEFLNESILKPFKVTVLSFLDISWIFWVVIAVLGIIIL